MVRRRSSEHQSLRYKVVLVFALTSLIPLLVALYILQEQSLLWRPEVSRLLGLSLAVAVLGFILLLRTVKQIRLMAEHLSLPMDSLAVHTSTTETTLTDTQAMRLRQQPARRLLIIDDDHTMSELITNVLIPVEYQVETVLTAERGLQSLREEDFDLIVCDIQVPIMGGQHLYHQAVMAKPHLSRRFIFMTGDVLDHETQTFLHTSEALSLAKPFMPDTLLEVVAQAWQGVAGEHAGVDA